MSDFGSGKPFDDGYLGLDPRLESRRFSDSFQADYTEEHFSAGDEHKDDGYDMVSDAPIFEQTPFDNGFTAEDHHGVHLDSPSPFNESFNSEHPDFTSRGDFSPASDLNGHSFPAPDEGYEFMEPQQPPAFGSGTGSVLPPPEEMEPEEGFLLREWKRQNALRLEEKEQQERERLSMIMDDADAIKDEYKNKRSTHCEAQKKNNRDKEKVFLANQTHFHETADKHYWKAVSELIPTELPSIESKRGKDKDKKKTTVIFNQGPKPGKPTDLSRMRQVLLKLKHNPPAHMKTAPPPPPPKAEGEKAAADDKAAQPVSNPPVEVAA